LLTGSTLDIHVYSWARPQTSDVGHREISLFDCLKLNQFLPNSTFFYNSLFNEPEVSAGESTRKRVGLALGGLSGQNAVSIST
jgi:hypothetical protein